MQTVKVKEVIEQKGLDVRDVAQQLFPKNKFPQLALNRVMRGEAVLDADQISKLASLAGVSIAELYSGNWKATTKDGVHVFTNGEFRAELDTKTWVTKVFHNSSMFHESIIHSGSTPISEYLQELDSIISKYKKL